MTTGDFLYEDALAMTHYYQDVLGLDTKSDLGDPGGHCALSSTLRREIWEWLSRGGDSDPAPVGSDDDADGDGIINAVDMDDDNDGAWDMSASVWMGNLQSPSLKPVLVAIVDWDVDGTFNSAKARVNSGFGPAEDFVCVDLNRNGVLDECNYREFGWSAVLPAGVRPGETFTLDEQEYRIEVAPTGHKAEILRVR